VGPQLLDRGEHHEDQLEVDAEEVGARKARVEALAHRHVPDHLLVVSEVPRRAGHAIKALELGVKGPGERDRCGQQRHGGADPPRQRPGFRSALAAHSQRFDAHFDRA